MSTETGIKYINNRFSYNAELGIYYKNIKEGFMLVAKFTYKNVDIYKLCEMPESPEDIDGKIEIHSFNPDNPEHCQRLNNLLK